MCLLVLEKWDSKRHMSKAEFDTAWRMNSDWFGILVNKSGKNFVNKTKDLATAWNWYNHIVAKVKYDYIVYHFRMGTSWWLGENMIHPFSLWKDKWLFHNGVLSFSSPTQSDTAMLAQTLKVLNEAGVCPLYDDVVTTMIEKVAGTYNKFIIAWPNEYIIFNEQAWHWNEGTWFSNYNYYVSEHDDYRCSYKPKLNSKSSFFDKYKKDENGELITDENGVLIEEKETSYSSYTFHNWWPYVLPFVCWYNYDDNGLYITDKTIREKRWRIYKDIKD